MRDELLVAEDSPDRFALHVRQAFPLRAQQERAIDTALNQLVRSGHIGLTQDYPLGRQAIVTILSGTARQTPAPLPPSAGVSSVPRRGRAQGVIVAQPRQSRS